MAAVDKNNENRRAYARTSVSLPVKYTILTQEDYQELKSKRLEAGKGKEQAPKTGLSADELMASGVDSTTLAILKHVDSKLNYIIDLLAKREHYSGGRRLQGEGKAVDISATGLKLLCSDNMDVGALLDLNFCLPLIPEVYLNIIGEARYVEQRNLEDGATEYEVGATEYEVGVKFLEISEEEQEALIKYTFQRQRELIRDKKYS